MTERIQSITILEVTDYEVVIHLTINLKHTVTVVDTGFLYWNMPHYMGLDFYETNVRYFQYKTEEEIDHYL